MNEFFLKISKRPAGNERDWDTCTPTGESRGQQFFRDRKNRKNSPPKKFLKFGGNPKKFFRYLSIADGFKVLFTSHLVVNIFFFLKNRETFFFL